MSFALHRVREKWEGRSSDRAELTSRRGKN
jgi:hypothetical protein